MKQSVSLEWVMVMHDYKKTIILPRHIISAFDYYRRDRNPDIIKILNCGRIVKRQQKLINLIDIFYHSSFIFVMI